MERFQQIEFWILSIVYIALFYQTYSFLLY